MALKDNLVAYWDMEQNPALFPIHDQTGRGTHLTAVNIPTLVDGKIAQGVQCAGNQALNALSNNNISHQGSDFTVAFWFKPLSLSAPIGLFGSAIGEWLVSIVLSGGNYYARIEVDPNGSDYTATLTDVPIEVGNWYFLKFGWSTNNGNFVWANVNMSERAKVVVTASPIAVPSVPPQFAPNPATIVFDETAVWRRSLSANELSAIYNDGDGLAFSEWDNVKECAAVDCCNDVAVAALTNEPCANICVDGTVLTYPPAGSMIAVPTYVVLSAIPPEAIIRYTTDGTAPDSLSTIYTGPILITNLETIIKAIAYADGCEPTSVVATTQFVNPSVPFAFSFACDTPDKGGQWNVFVPNGTNDWHWVLQFSLSALTTIKRLEVYQLDSSGNWTTGQAWSTNSPITTPFAAANPFSVFPLLVFEAAVQKWAAYQSSLGAFAAGTYTWDLYGDQAYPILAGNLFRLDFVLGDDTRLSQIIGSTCTSTPPLCIAPSAPVLTPQCGVSTGRINVAFTVLAGRNWKLYAALMTCGGTGIFAQIATGVGTGAPDAFLHGGLQEGCTYAYYISVDLVGCGYTDSSIVSATTPLFPTVSITSNKAAVEPGESFTLSWNSSQLHTSTCNGCAAGEIFTPFGCKPGNVAGSQSKSEAVCGLYTYEAKGCNPCGSVVASVQVDVLCAAQCTGVQPLNLTVPDALHFLCGFIAATCTPFTCEVCSPPALVWDGKLFKNDTRPCYYTTGLESCGGQQVMFGCIYDVQSCHAFCAYPFKQASIEFFLTTGEYDGPHWLLTIESCTETMWIGRKLFGANGTGTYTRVSGCATGPTTIVVT